jgi:YegS/Rv2252/BmrU family lipid kinase
MEKVLFIFNPRSGKGQIRNSLPEILDTGVKAGYDLLVHTTQSRGDAQEVVRERAKEFDRIVCSGGDGTLDEVVTGMMKSGERKPIGYIPAGSTNDYGNSLGIDKDMVRAAKIAFNGKPYSVDVGSFNDNYFVYVAAFGLFTEVSYQTSQDLKNMIGHAAYILEGAKQLRDIPSYMIQIEYDGNVIYDEFIFGMITNSRSVGGFTQILPGDVELNDGIFEVMLVKKPRNPLELTEILNALTTNRDSEMLYQFSASQIRFRTSLKISWTLDGEYGGTTDDVKITNCHRAVEIMIDS